MTKKTFVLASLVSLFPFHSLSALELRLPGELSTVEVPAVRAASPDMKSLRAEYDEIYSALEFYSDAAYAARQNSPEFLEASASGQYLRSRLEGVSRGISKLSGAAYHGGAGSRRLGGVSARIRSEMNDALGFDRPLSSRNRETRGVPIKQGYCQINYVKNNVPFLVQYDGFLEKGEVILTFDDGPGQLTEEVSAAMKEGKAPSLFFVLGANLGDSGKARLKVEAADGHSVGVHGYNHATPSGKPFTALSTAETLKQLGGVSDSITSVIGTKPDFFRPPYGIISPEALKAIDSELGLVPVGWTIDTLDWSTKDPEALFQKTISLIKERGKGIVLMHDIHPQSRTAAKRLVVWLAENGYKVVPPERMSEAFRGRP